MNTARAATVLLLLALAFAAPPESSAASRPSGGGKKAAESAPPRPADNAAVLSGGGHSVTVAEGKRLLSKSMSTHLPQGVTDRRYVEATLRDALYEKLTVGALHATGADRQYAQEGRVIRNRIVGFRFLPSVVDKRLAPTPQEEAARYPRAWARARFRQVTFATAEEAEAARAAAVSDPGSFEALARSRTGGIKTTEGGLTAFLDPLPFNIMMTPGMDAALFTLRPGEFSPVLETPIGFSVYQAVEFQPMAPEDVAAKKRKIAERILDEKRGTYLDALRERFRPYNMFADNQAAAYALLLAYLQKGEGSGQEVVRAGDTRLSFDSVLALRTLFKLPPMGKDDPVSAMGRLEALVRQSIVPDALLAQAAEEEGFRLGERDEAAVRERVERWQLDRFYDAKIGPLVKVTDNEVRSAFEGNREMFRRPRRVDYRVIETSDAAKIREAERRMEGKGGFDAGWKWAREKKANAARGKGEHKGVLVDDVGESTVRDALRGLRPGGRSGVLSYESRFYIVSLDRVEEWEDLPFESVEGVVRRNIEERKRREALAAFFAEQYPGLTLETDPAGLDYLAEFFGELREERKTKATKGAPSPLGAPGAPGGKKK